MPHTVDAVFQDELRRAGLPGRGAPAHLLALLRGRPRLTCRWPRSRPWPRRPGWR
ncbi:hypothetical protein ACRAWD_29390 [Caulobacter segnis]